MRFPAGAVVRRSLLVLGACQLLVGAPLASAQTVIVRHAAAGSTVELVLNARAVGTATVDTAGVATITAPDSEELPIDANVWVDVCVGAYRVILARSGAQPVVDPACRRDQVAGLFLVQRISSIVVDVRDTPSLRIRQGPVPDAWLRDPVSGATQASARPPLPPLTGLTLFGGAGRGTTLNFESQACGAVASCTDNSPLPYTGGVAWWFTKFVAAEARYAYLGNLEAQATEDTFRFTTTREGGVLSFSGRGGVQVGRVRPFGRAGLSLHRATLTTTQTLDDSTVVIDGVSQTVPGGTQVFQVRTRGWAPVYGGGVEVWLSPVVGIYGEMQRIGLKGSDDRGADIDIDDALVTIQGGLTVRFR
jgi:hypothetical protein